MAEGSVAGSEGAEALGAVVQHGRDFGQVGAGMVPTQFGHDGTAYWARRADTGNVLSDPDLAEFRQMVWMDYCHRPLPQGHNRGLMPWAGWDRPCGRSNA
jgi:hypothetical protein